MLTSPKLIEIDDRQFHYPDQASSLISIHGTICEMNQLDEDYLPELGKWKINFTTRTSTPKEEYNIIKEQLEKSMKETRSFEKKDA
jgi:hypothetical protein